EVVLEAVVHRGRRQLDELRLAIDHAREIVDVDSIVGGRFDDANVEATARELEQVNERAVEVEPVGDDISVRGTIESECTDDEVLAGAGAGNERDLGGLRVDQLREERLGIEPLARAAA